MRCVKIAIVLSSAVHSAICGLDYRALCVAYAWTRIRIGIKAVVEVEMVWRGAGRGCNPLDEMNINAVRAECCWSRAFWYIATRTIAALNKMNGMGGTLTM